MKTLSHKTEDLSIADVSSYYPDQWVVVEITGRDKYGWPEKGKVIGYSDDKRKLIQETKHLKGDLYLFYTGLVDGSKVA
ncbi:MAG: hypothetical protein EWV83_13125 [Microcystis sp. M_OC_Ca_00000000_S217Cul]|uniref:hypothetical protein n=1 Tax=unclassified Microcystis TaxID=2643300 RepID=UPI0011945225|nr:MULTISPECIES: hypothetical protein [unclassified Microcystis]TRT75505.1 MAG: hypothetical protein EWV83_13125 [Microcystis sp. M_OC_Ca_00000000_S217Cul]TRT87253.1 MAG: hypothetical protein EWV66_14560 [Microcystis sp. M_OC_Ca_00000000_C217Col]